MNEWEKQKLGEVCSINPPKREARKKLKGNDLVSFLPMSELGIKTKKIEPIESRCFADVVKGYTYFAENDVLLAKITPCFENGKLGIARNLTNKTGFGSSEYIVFRPKKDIEPEFIFYFLSQDIFRKIGGRFMRGTAGQKRVSKDFIKDYPIFLPPLPEQKQIVAILDEAFEGIDRAIANTEKNLANTRELFENYLNAIFTQKREKWRESTLDQLCSKITDGVHHTPKYKDKGIPFLSVKDLTKGFIDFNSTKFVSPEDHAVLIKRCHPEFDDVLYTKVGTTGVAKVVDTNREFSIFVSVALLKPKHKVIFNHFLEHFLNSKLGRDQAKKRTRGMANKNLVIRDIRQILVLYPQDLGKQKEVVKKLDNLLAETQRLESIYQRKLEALQELKQSILHKAFTGELTNPQVKEDAA